MLAMLKKIKTEAFFIRRLFSQKYGFIDYFNYFKNKLFGDYFLFKLPKHECSINNDFEIHVLCQKNDAHILGWALKSFLHFSKLCPNIIVHDDGSFDKKLASMFESKFSNLRVLFKTEADQLIKNYPGLPDDIRKYRDKGHPIVKEFFDLFLLSNAKKVMICDSDLLFFKRPTEIIDFVNGKSQFDALISRHNKTYDLMVSKEYEEKHKLIEKSADLMNPGLILINRESLTLDMFVDYFRNTRRGVEDYFLGMAGWGSLISQVNFDFFPPDTYIIKYRPNENTVMKHFTSPRRYDFFAYGIDIARKNMLTNE